MGRTMLSIIIVNFKNPALLRLCIKSVLRVIDPGFRHEIIVVDIASSIETSNVVLEEFKDIRLVSFRSNIGFTRGVNEGIKKSRGDYFLILNPDVIPLDNSIESLHNYLNDNHDVGMIGPRLLNFDGTSQNSCFRFPSPGILLLRRTFMGELAFGKKKLDQYLMRDCNLKKICYPGWLMGSAIMVSKKAVEKIGLMDENLFLYMNDVDWPRRFWENGYKVVYYPESTMYHYHKRDSKGRFILFDLLLKKETRWHIKDAIRYFRKYSGKLDQYQNKLTL